MINDKKLILFDVDDTLVDHSQAKSQIPKTTVKAIQGLKDKGYYVGIATGRSYAHIKFIMEKLDLKVAVSYGGHMVTVDGKQIFKQYIDGQEVNHLIKAMFRTIYPVVCFDESHIYVKDFLGKIKREMYKEENFIEGETHPATIMPMIKLDRKKRNYLSMMVFKPKIKDMEKFRKLDFNPWGKLGFEVYSKGISKFSGIEVLAKYLNVSMDNVYAFGDNYNDLHMLSQVKNSVAVGNGVKEVKEVASYVSPPIYDGGILTACIELGLLEESYE